MSCHEVRDRIWEEGPDAPSVAAHLLRCEDCREVAAGAKSLRAASAAWRDEPIPAWNRAAVGPPRPAHSRRWATWLPLAACLALTILTAFRMEIARDASGWSVQFGATKNESQLDQAQVTSLIEDAIASSERQMVYRVQESLERLRQDSEAHTKSLIIDLARYTREERAEDMARLVTTWSDRRERDMALVENQIQNLIDLNQSNRSTLYQLANMMRSMPPSSAGEE